MMGQALAPTGALFEIVAVLARRKAARLAARDEIAENTA